MHEPTAGTGFPHPDSEIVGDAAIARLWRKRCVIADGETLYQKLQTGAKVMLASLFVMLALSLLLVVLTATAMWFDVSKKRDRILAERLKSARTWQRPFIRGSVLFFWAKDAAIDAVKRRLGGQPSASTAIELSEELHSGTTRAMLPLAAERDLDCAIPCPEEGQGMIGVTAPEAIAIAEYIRRNLPLAEMNRIHDLAEKNAAQVRNVDHWQFDAHQTPCPLQGEDRVCKVYGARPLRCRPLHAATILRRLGMKTSVDEERDFDEQIVEQGVETGLTEGLASAGRDGNIFELNSALVTALETPEAAERWAKGEEVFARCKRYM